MPVVCIFLHHAIEILYILLICMNILNANYIILLYCTTSPSAYLRLSR